MYFFRILALSLFLTALLFPEAPSAESVTTVPFDTSWVPQPVFDSKPALIDLYNVAWNLAWQHVHTDPGAPKSPFMDEAFQNGVIWIWDTEFMSMFCKYAPHRFPGVESFENFWHPIHDNVTSTQIIWHPDNPPFFAWVEWENYRFTGDKGRLRWLIDTTRYLQRHFDYFEKLRQGQSVFGSENQAAAQMSSDSIGYQWDGVASGMDNSPRGRSSGSIYWIDAMAQQALAAVCIARLAHEIGNTTVETQFTSRYNQYKQRINQHYWDATDGFYYDIDAGTGHAFDKVKTPTSYWAMLAGVPDSNQANRMIRFISDPDAFGGAVMLPSLARNDWEFDPTGGYWKGSVWLPLAYMSIKAMEKYGYYELADSAARSVVNHMLATYQSFTPRTIWECYNPTQPKPATVEGGELVRADFCGWSALGPISLFIENYLGFHLIDATAKRVEWRKYQSGRHGIRRLAFGSIITDIIGDGNTVTVSSNDDYTLVINGVSFPVTAGNQSISLDQATANAQSPTDPLHRTINESITVRSNGTALEISRLLLPRQWCTIELYAANGVLIRTISTQVPTIRIKTGNLASGIYALTIRSGRNNITRRIML